MLFMLCARSSNSRQPIWGTYMSSSYTDTCYGTRNTCPLTSITSCNHSNVATVECSKLLNIIHFYFSPTYHTVLDIIRSI